MQYTQGTVSVTNGSATVTGSNTEWLSNVSAGHSFKVQGESVIYTIASVNSNTQLTLSANYAGTTKSGVGYQITRDFTPTLNLAEIYANDKDWTSHLTIETIRRIDEKLGTNSQPRFKNLFLNIQLITSTKTLERDSFFSLINSSGGAITINLPTASGYNGEIHFFKKISSDSNIITIDPYGTELIDGLSTYQFSTQNTSFGIIAYNGAWYKFAT